MGRGILLALILGLPLGAQANDLPYLDKDFGCIEKNTAEDLVERFQIDTTSFGGLELCSPTVDTKKLFNDLIIVRDGKFAGHSNNTFIKDFIPSQNYFPWLQSMTYGVRRGHDVPFATAYNSGGYFTMQDGWAKLSTLGRVGTIIHEARHTEGFYHLRCNQGPYMNSNVSGCDTSLEAGGSHGVEMEYYARVSEQGENFHPVYKSMARLMLLARSNFVFNRPAMTEENTVLAVGEKDGYLVDEDTLKSVGFKHEDNMVMKRTSFGASWFGGGKARALDFYAPQETFALLEDDYSYFKMLKMDTLPKNIIDIEEYDVAGKRYLVILNNSNKIYSYHFASGSWSSPITVPGEKAEFLTPIAPNGDKGVFVVLKNQAILPFDAEEETMESALSVKWDENISSYAFLKGDLLSVGSNGVVKKHKDGTPSPLFENVSVKQILNVPVYNVF